MLIGTRPSFLLYNFRVKHEVLWVCLATVQCESLHIEQWQSEGHVARTHATAVLDVSSNRESCQLLAIELPIT